MKPKEAVISPAVSFAAQAADLITALQQPQAFDHPVKYVKLLQTHISWILLTGNFAYKIKKPVDFGFVDFSTLEKRKYYCAEELRLNRRFAPQIYLDRVAIRESPSGPRLFGSGKIIDYAVKMREFSQQDLLSAYATDRRLTPAHIDEVAVGIARLHETATPAGTGSNFGSAEQVCYWGSENLGQITASIPAENLPTDFNEFRDSCLELCAELGPLFNLRKQQGFVRECHGDLHLANMALVDDRVTLFDCIEFNPALRWIDTCSEMAFVAMDLHARDYRGYCWRFINQYLETSGDYAAIAQLRYYFVYRALVRAKVAALRLTQQPDNSASHARSFDPALDYIALARLWSANKQPGLIIMHGLSGSGKSTFAAQLLEAIGAIRIRSDVERKRLFDYPPLQITGADLGQGIYRADATEATYSRLCELAERILNAGFCVIVDATFLQEAQRLQFIQLAREWSLRAIIIDCEAADAVLRQRIISRASGATDASEANLVVLDRQLMDQQPISSLEREQVRVITATPSGISTGQVETIRHWLAS